VSVKIKNLETGEIIIISRDVRATHPAWVHEQMGTESESELQAALDCVSTSDFYSDGERESKGFDAGGLLVEYDDWAEKWEIADEIAAASEKMCIERIGYRPPVWYTGGSSHNDDRLTAKVLSDGEIYVSDGNATERYDGGMDGVEGYVADWLSDVWDGAENE